MCNTYRHTYIGLNYSLNLAVRGYLARQVSMQQRCSAPHLPGRGAEHIVAARPTRLVRIRKTESPKSVSSETSPLGKHAPRKQEPRSIISNTEFADSHAAGRARRASGFAYKVSTPRFEAARGAHAEQAASPSSRDVSCHSIASAPASALATGIGISAGVGIVHYEYMALAKKTSALREAMLFYVEPRRFMCPAECADIV